LFSFVDSKDLPGKYYHLSVNFQLVDKPFIDKLFTENKRFFDNLLRFFKKIEFPSHNPHDEWQLITKKDSVFGDLITGVKLLAEKPPEINTRLFKDKVAAYLLKETTCTADFIDKFMKLYHGSMELKLPEREYTDVLNNYVCIS